MSSKTPDLRKLSEDYTEKALRKQELDGKSFYNKLFNSKVRNERRVLKKETEQKRKIYIHNYIIRRYPNEDPSKPSKEAKKAASDSFDNKIQGILTLKNEETKRKNKLRRQQLEKRKAEEKVRQERINNECTKLQTKEECVSPQNINNCYWNVKLKKNQYGDTLWDNTCQKITKRSIQIGKRKRKSKRKLSSLGSISEEGGESKELSTNALTAEQRRLLTLEVLNPGKNMSAGKRKRKTRKRKRRRTKKKRRRNKRKSKKNKRKSKRRR